MSCTCPWLHPPPDPTANSLPRAPSPLPLSSAGDLLRASNFSPQCISSLNVPVPPSKQLSLTSAHLFPAGREEDEVLLFQRNLTPGALDLSPGHSSLTSPLLLDRLHPCSTETGLLRCMAPLLENTVLTCASPPSLPLTLNLSFPIATLLPSFRHLPACQLCSSGALCLPCLVVLLPLCLFLSVSFAALH